MEILEIKKVVLIKYIGNDTEVVVPESVTCIGDDAFRGCTRLKSVTIPNSMTSIGEWAFLGCTGLTNVTAVNIQLCYCNWGK